MKAISLTVMPYIPKWIQECEHEVCANLIRGRWVWYVKVDGEWVKRDPQPTAEDEGFSL